MKRFTAIILAMVMLLSLSVLALADNFANDVANEMKVALDENGKPLGEAAAVTEMNLYMDRNGKVVKGLDGKKYNGRIYEKVVQEFYRVMMGVPVDWSKFDCMEFDVFMDINNVVTFGKQTMYCLDGTSVSSENAEVVVFDTPAKFHPVGSGSAKLFYYDYYGKELGSSDVNVRMLSTGDFVFTNICSKCGQDQGMDIHVMACGHFKCEVGEVGHGAGYCGIPGHMNCDGKDHSACPNCLKPLCSGEHGVGVCEHVHNWVFAGGWYNPSHTGWVNRYYCAGCETYIFGEAIFPEGEN